LEIRGRAIVGTWPDENSFKTEILLLEAGCLSTTKDLVAILEIVPTLENTQQLIKLRVWKDVAKSRSEGGPQQLQQLKQLHQPQQPQQPEQPIQQLQQKMGETKHQAKPAISEERLNRQTNSHHKEIELAPGSTVLIFESVCFRLVPGENSPFMLLPISTEHGGDDQGSVYIPID
jgi:hypothetical protein